MAPLAAVSGGNFGPTSSVAGRAWWRSCCSCVVVRLDPDIFPWAIMKPFYVKVGRLLELTDAAKNIDKALAEHKAAA